MPVVLETAPAACDRLVLAVLRRGRRPPHREGRGRPTRAAPLPKLGPPAMIFRASVALDAQRGEGWAASPDRLPPLREALPQAGAGHW
jgi:hypothetical protein